MKLEELQEYREDFIEYMCRKYLVDKETATLELEAFLEGMDIEDIDVDDFQSDADECISCWQE